MELQQRAEQAVRLAERKARNYSGLALPDAKIDFSLRGRCAGQAQMTGQGRLCIRINLQLLTDNCDDYLTRTIPHEVAHLLVNWQHRKRRRKPQPHGPEWQAVMTDCFDLEPQRCHSYATTPARVVPRNFLYLCSCREHKLTSIMHNRIRKTGGALCRICKGSLQFSTQLDPS
jgi:SprT protein